MIKSNIDYYDNNADSFFKGSIEADMSYERNTFISFLPDKARVLDAGCGSGRDSKAFLDAGYDVIAFDASREMCNRATQYVGIKVYNISFEDMQYVDEFDGIWACASLLHVPITELPNIMQKMNAALRANGAIYASFKYGNGMTKRGERIFSDFDENSIVPLFENAGFKIARNEKGSDSRPGREEEKWINVIALKL